MADWNEQFIICHLFCEILYRCWISECEPFDSAVFDSELIKFTIPSAKNGQPDTCFRYQFRSLKDDVFEESHGFCSEANFNKSVVVPCERIIIKNGEERLSSRVSYFVHF